MKKIIVVFLLFLLVFPRFLFAEFFAEREMKMITTNYYQALIDEDYEKAFHTLYLYDVAEGKHPTDGTTLSDQEAKEFYMKKIAFLKAHHYKLKDYEIKKIRYEDGHTAFLEMKLEVEHDGQKFQYAETVHVWEEKVWIMGEEDDPFRTYRDGKMKFEIPVAPVN
ncbi:nuclear transport factor 2 family protein [Brevibacillus sp. DP1.3A]|uniref:nuclear transport factor 2 family protein n=1 Tax=Brevibacillus sp. DP1.3A TaxID=2738867 RepID=UPI00156B1C1A|nr:nuclear transport factor 2 family protein [Brevibacillus sp. DP1.3A]UED73193.1 nuclear transport factor 2 family protein [Brevibacillus sp. DP1.3A]